MPTQAKFERKRQELKSIIKEKVWEEYPAAQKAGHAPDQTTRFFSQLKSDTRKAFLESKKPVVQFGVASGKFLEKQSDRKRIGYDYTVASKKHVEFEHRLTDLNEINDGKLSCQTTIENYLSKPCDIFLRL
jgi:hypothetical protein